MTTSAASRLRQHQRVTPLAARLAAMGLGDPAALCTVHAPLTGSLTLTKGAGSITHSRADTFAPTTTDHEGIVRVCKTGEVRFLGLRRIQNLLPYSEDLSRWDKYINGTGVTPIVYASSETPPAGSSCQSIILNRGAGTNSSDFSGIYQYIAPTLAAGRVLCYSVYVKAATASDVGRHVQIGMGWSLTTVTLTADWQRYVHTFSSSGSGDFAQIYAQGHTSEVSVHVLVSAAQVEDVTNQSDTSAGEYVSTGVASAPSYHGANVDGVRYYATTQAGAAIAGGGLLVEGSAQNLLNSTDLASALWYGCTASNDGTMGAGLSMCKLSKASAAAFEARRTDANGNSAVASGWYAIRVWLLASANSSQCNVGLYASAAGWGVNADSAIKTISGPASVSQAGGGLAIVTGLSTTVVTCIEIKRKINAAEVVSCIIYPDTSASTTVGRAIYAAVGTLEAGSICTSRIPTSGSMLTRPADSVTLPTAGNLGAEWGAMSATVTLPSVSAYNSSRVVANLDGQSNYPAYVYDTPGGSSMALSVWGAATSKSMANASPGVALQAASAWRSGSTCSITTGGATPAATGGAATAVALPTNVRIGSGPSAGSNPLHGAIRDLKFYGLDLTAAQLQTVTA